MNKPCIAADRRSVQWGVRITALVTISGVLATCVCLARVGSRVASTSDAASNRSPAPPDLPNAQQLSNMFGTAARRVLPSVVQIKSAAQQERRPDAFDWPDRLGGMPFDDFFEDDAFSIEDSLQQDTLGCGVIIDPAGTVLTNNHIVADSEDLLVELPDGQQLRVKDVKTDPQTDLALLTLHAPKPVPAAQLGRSSDLRIGDWVLTIGSPLGLEQTVSAGIISATGRSVKGAGKARLLQTDAAINPGSSGGALVNLQGELVGITTAIASRDGGYQGVGFAIPIDLAKWVAAQLREHGRVRRGYLGATFAARSDSRTDEEDKGVPVVRVVEDSPADRAGILRGDKVISIDGQPAVEGAELNASIERAVIGSKHRLEVARGQDRKIFEVTIGELPHRPSVEMRDPPRHAVRSELIYSRDLGVVVGDVNENIAGRLGLQATTGVLVVRTDRDGAAARAGIRKGMVILRVGDKPISGTSDFAQIMERESLEAGIRVEVRGRGETRRIDIGGPRR